MLGSDPFHALLSPILALMPVRACESGLWYFGSKCFGNCSKNQERQISQTDCIHRFSRFEK